jgi:hypothetical protein
VAHAEAVVVVAGGEAGTERDAGAPVGRGDELGAGLHGDVAEADRGGGAALHVGAAGQALGLDGDRGLGVAARPGMVAGGAAAGGRGVADLSESRTSAGRQDGP